MAKRKGLTCVLFSDVPPDTNYRVGAYSWVKSEDAEHYIAGGFGAEYNPYKGEIEHREPPTMDDNKDEIIQYLKDEGIPHKKSDTKAELLDLI